MSEITEFFEATMELFTATIKNGEDIPNWLAKDVLEVLLTAGAETAVELEELQKKLERIEYFEQVPTLGTA